MRSWKWAYLPETWLFTLEISDFSHDFADLLSVCIDSQMSLHQKPTKWPMCPTKPQIILDIQPVWSVSLLSTQWIAKVPRLLHVDSEDGSDWTDSQADLSLRWAHMSFCWFCHALAQTSLQEGFNNNFGMLYFWFFMIISDVVIV